MLLASTLFKATSMTKKKNTLNWGTPQKIISMNGSMISKNKEKKRLDRPTTVALTKETKKRKC